VATSLPAVSYPPITTGPLSSEQQSVGSLFHRIEGKRTRQTYSELIRLELAVPMERHDNFLQEIKEKSQGRIPYLRR